MKKKERKCIFSEHIQKKISIFCKKKITSDKKYQIHEKTTSEEKNQREKFHFFKEKIDETKRKMLNFSNKTFNSEKKDKNSEFQVIKKRNISLDRKNPNENLQDIDQKNIEIFHQISLNQSDFLDFDKENIKPQENSLTFENETLDKTNSLKQIQKNRKNFLEEVTLFDLKRKEDERKKTHRAKKLYK